MLTQGRCATQVSHLHVTWKQVFTFVSFQRPWDSGTSLVWDWSGRGNIQEVGTKQKLWKAQRKQIQTAVDGHLGSCPKGEVS